MQVILIIVYKFQIIQLFINEKTEFYVEVSTQNHVIFEKKKIE
jgi:hypothetical protein